MVRLMPLPPHHLCFSKIQNGLSFSNQPTQAVLEKRPLNDCVLGRLIYLRVEGIYTDIPPVATPLLCNGVIYTFFVPYHQQTTIPKMKLIQVMHNCEQNLQKKQLIRLRLLVLAAEVAMLLISISEVQSYLCY